MDPHVLHRNLVPSTRWGILAVLLATLVGCDQGVKYYAVQNWKHAGQRSYLGDTIRIVYAENPGSFLGLFQDAPEWVRVWGLTVGNALLLSGLFIYLAASKRVHAGSFLGLALVLAGGIGNLIDRLRIHGVIDHWNVGIGNLRSGVFNVADMAIMGGCVILLFLYYHVRTHSAPAERLVMNKPGQSQA